MSPICTHQSTVQQWECDDNEHLNAQFYADRFQQAAATFANATRLGDRSKAGQRLTLRFYREAQVTQPLMVESAIVEGFPSGDAIGHRLLDASTGAVLATAIVPLSSAPNLLHLLASQPEIPPIPSRPFESRFDTPGTDPHHPNAPNTEQAALDIGGFHSGSVIVVPADVDAEGHCLHRFHVGFFGQGAAIAWNIMGLSPDVLQSHHWGCMVTQLSMHILKSVTIGTPVKQISRIVELRSRTVTMRHDQFNDETGEAIACALATGMLVSLDTRRAIKFPLSA